MPPRFSSTQRALHNPNQGAYEGPTATPSQTPDAHAPTTDETLWALAHYGYTLDPVNREIFKKTGRIELPEEVASTLYAIVDERNASNGRYPDATNSTSQQYYDSHRSVDGSNTNGVDETSTPRNTRRHPILRATLIAAMLPGALGLTEVITTPSLRTPGKVLDTIGNKYVRVLQLIPDIATKQHQTALTPANVPQSTQTPVTSGSPSASPSQTAPALPTTSEAQPSAAAGPTAETCVQQLEKVPVEKLIAQTIMIPINGDGKSKDGKTSAEAVLSVVRKYDIGGVIVMTEPTIAIKTLSQTGNTDVPLVIAIDDEGGVVNRFTSAANKTYPSQEVMAKKTAAEITQLVTSRSQLLKSLGINTNFAPVVDLTPKDGSNSKITQSRIFSGDPSRVAELSSLYAQAMLSQGINPVYKHFGGGSMTNNTDNSPGKVPPLSELESRDLLPYKTIHKNNQTGLMIGTFEPVTGPGSGVPANQSTSFYALAKQYGFTGPIFTDDIGTKAAGGNLPRDFVDALEAGATMPLYVQDQTTPRTLEEQLQTIINKGVEDARAGKLTAALLANAVERNSRAIGVDTCSVVAGLRK